MKRTLAVAVVTAAVLAAMAWPASAKGEGPVGATISGPGIDGPTTPGSGGGSTGGGSGHTPGAAIGTIEIISKQGFEPMGNNPLWRLATFSGLVTSCSSCASFIDTSAPKDRSALGLEYRVTYYSGKCCKDSVRQVLYPYAPGGPVAYTTNDAGKGFFLSQHHVGWWHADGRMGVLFRRMLQGLGFPKANPVATAPVAGSAAAAEVTSSQAGNAWRVPLAAGLLALLLVLGAAAARPKSPPHPA